MNVVIDTNILVSAFVFGGQVKHKLEQIVAHEDIHLITSSAINSELEEVLFREKFQRFQAKRYLESQLSAFLADALTVPIEQVFTDCRDPKDNKFLNAAVNGHADFIITGDDDLLVLHPFHGVKIVTMTDFITYHL